MKKSVVEVKEVKLERETEAETFFSLAELVISSDKKCLEIFQKIKKKATVTYS
ncbi:hypothetical protein [Jeotgalibacillus marinus]|uniref:Uncharacterized protein n=1 Tax=Jeotgalibacillus marinus TaxID=86667 RepID=A0ABV3Q4G6_9BACL